MKVCEAGTESIEEFCRSLPTEAKKLRAGCWAVSLVGGAVRIKLAEQGGHASWEGGTGGGGFPRLVPDYHGRAFSGKLQALIDRELLRFACASEAKHKKWKKK